jgi:hypothetical protein
MSTPVIPSPGKLYLSILSSGWRLFWPALLDILEEKFGPADYLTDLIPFTETAYYDQELGTPLSRRIMTFEALAELDALAEIKLFTNEIEERYKTDGNRIFNLDPGIVTMERLVLATGKNFTHRVYLSKGIWADLTLIFTRGDWKDLEWTFPDYCSEKIKKHLRIIRKRYYEQARQNKRSA